MQCHQPLNKQRARFHSSCICLGLCFLLLILMLPLGMAVYTSKQLNTTAEQLNRMSLLIHHQHEVDRSVLDELAVRLNVSQGESMKEVVNRGVTGACHNGL